MDKPITVAREDFLNELVILVNNSHLPAFAIVDCMNEILPSIKHMAQEQYQADLKKYKEGDQNG